MSQKPVTGLLIDGTLNQEQGKLIQKALQNQPFISNKKSKTGRLITFEPSSRMPLDPTIYLKESIQDMVSLINGLVPHVDRYLVVVVSTFSKGYPKAFYGFSGYPCLNRQSNGRPYPKGQDPTSTVRKTHS